MKRLFAFLCLLCTLAVLAVGSAEDYGSDICMQVFMQNAVNGIPTILYTGITKTGLSMRSQPDRESEPKGVLNEHATVQIFGFDQTWLYCWDDNVGVYYLIRQTVDEITKVRADAPAYGVIPNHYVATMAVDTALYAEPNKDSEAIFECAAGSRISFWLIRDGWAVVPYRRLIGYVFLGDLANLEPVAPSVEYAKPGDIISVFTTFYSVKNTELNIGRMENIRVGCSYINNVYQPGQEFNFNQIAGPYRRNRGYMPSPVLVDGDTVAGYGGGTCQVSTTLYNALLQLGSGINIIWRRPHGPSGASYAPHGVDAAVGAQNLNLIFQDAFDFPIEIDSTAMNGALCICIRKADALN